MTQITVTRALAQLKRLDHLLSMAYTQAKFSMVHVGVLATDTKLTDGSTSYTRTEADSLIQGSKDKVQSLYKQKIALKKAINESNSITTVEIDGVTYTVAELLILKSELDLKHHYLQHLRRNLAEARTMVTNTNASVEKEIQVLEKAMVESEDKEGTQAIIDGIRLKKTASIYKEQDILKEIEEVTNYINKFEVDVDYNLSESNATTVLEVDLTL